MGFPKKISQFPVNPELKGQDLLVTVNEFDITSRINLQQLREFVIDGKDNTFVTGGTVTEDAELTLFRNDGLSLTVDLNPAFSNTLTGAENIPGGEGLIFSGKTNNELLLRSISAGDNVTIETLNNTIKVSVDIPPDTNTFVTGSTLDVNNILKLERNDGVIITTDLDILSDNTFISGATLDGVTYTLFRNDGVEIPTNFNSVISGSVTTTLFDSYTASTETQIDSKLNINTFNTYSASTKTDIDSKLDITTFDTYSASTKTDIDSKLDITTFDTYSGSTKTDIDSKLDITTFDSYSATTETQIDSKLDITTFDSYSATTETEIDSKLDITTFDSYTANTSDIYVSGGTLNGTDLLLERTDDDVVTIDLSSLSGVTQNSFSTGFTYDNNNNLIITRNDGLNSLSTNISQMSGLTINGELTVTSNTQLNGTLNLFNTPTLNNSGSEMLVRNTSTGQIDYRDVSTLSGTPIDTFVTGLTYNSNINTVTLTQNENGPNQSVVINTFSGVTLNGSTAINGNTIVDGNVLITKNVVILGTATTINSSTFSVDDNIITLNANATGSTVPLPIDSGIDILRNSGDTAVLLWEELNGYWAAGLSGATEPLIVNGNNLGGGQRVFFKRKDNVLDFNTLSGGTNVTLTKVGNLIRFDVPDDTNTFVSGATLNGNSLEIERNDGVDIPVDLSSLISGKVNITSFDTYTASTETQIDSKLDTVIFDTYTSTTVDNNTFVSGGTLNGTDLLLERTDDDVVTIDLSALSGVTQNSFVTGFTYDNNNFTISRNDGLSALTINVSQMSGLTINGELTVTGNTQLDGRLTVEEQTWFKGSPTTFGNSVADSIDFTGRINGNFVPVNDNSSDMGKPTGISSQKYWRNFYVYNITGGTLNLFNTPTINNSSGDILVRNSSTGQIEIREIDSLSGNTISSTDLVGTQYTINENDGGSFTTDFNPIVSGKLDTDLFDSFTGNTINDATNLTTTGIFAQKNGNNLEFKGLQSSGGTVTITSDSNTVNIESSTSGGNTVNSATKAFNWFMTIT